MVTARRSPIPFILIILSGCASGPGPDLNGPEGPTLMAAYSGDWTLLRLESDDLNEAMGELQAGPSGGGMTGGRGGGMTGGGRGGMTGGGRGGMTGGSRGGMPGSMDPQAMRAAMQAIRTLAEPAGELSLNLTPGVVLFRVEGVTPMELTFGAEEEQFRQGTLNVFARAKWTKKGIEIEREVDEGGAVKDELSIDDQDRLVVKRKIDVMGNSVDGTLLYRRETGL